MPRRRMTPTPNKAVMVQCAKTNAKYMDMRVGQVAYSRLVKLYRRIAEASVGLAEEYSDGAPRPSPHEPAVDAFWTAAAAWSHNFTVDVLRSYPTPNFVEDNHGICSTFCGPHRQFAQWLRPQRIRVYPFASAPPLGTLKPGKIILLHDHQWTMQVIKLTARWGLWYHLKDIPVLWETRRLLQDLKTWPDGNPPRGIPAMTIATDYLQADLVFLEELFGHFKLSPAVKDTIQVFLARAQEEVAYEL